jgi:hypothetical protein
MARATAPIKLGLPFVHLNLRCNPFGELTPAQRARMAIVESDSYLSFLKQKRAALVFVGHRGRGKTTHLLALQSHFPKAPYVYLPEDGPRPKVPFKEPVLFLDESQRLSWWSRARLFSGPGTLIIGTHCDEEKALRRARRPVQVIPITGLNRARLRSIVDRRINWSRRSRNPVPSFSEADLNILIEHFGDNLRAIEFYLYEVFQGLIDNGPIQLDQTKFPELKEEDCHG